MNAPQPTPTSSDSKMRAEFDQLADQYYEELKSNLAMSGEGPEYFAEYKIADLAKLVADLGLKADRILDFGSGIGSSVPFFRTYFPRSQLHCADVSARSIELAQARLPGEEKYVLVGDEGIPLPSQSQDVVFSACVFHHIPHEEHARWLSELHRVTRPGGLLAIYEHNPLNPLTVRVVKSSPIDANAHLIRASAMRQRIATAGWRDPRIAYRLFFPAFLKALRPLERHLGWLGAGAQYRAAARKAPA